MGNINSLNKVEEYIKQSIKTVSLTELSKELPSIPYKSIKESLDILERHNIIEIIKSTNVTLIRLKKQGVKSE